MSTVAGLVRTFRDSYAGVDPIPPQPGQAAQPRKPGLLDRIGENLANPADTTHHLQDAQKKELINFLEEQEKALQPLIESDKGRTTAIQHLLKKNPEKAEQLGEIKEAFQKRHESIIREMRTFHERQYEALEQKLENIQPAIPADQQKNILDGLRVLQQRRIEALEKRAATDDERLTNLVSDRDRAFSAAMLIGHFKPEKDEKKDMFGREQFRPAGPLVERWRPTLWPTIKKGLMNAPLGIGEKIEQWTGEDRDLFDQPGEVEAKFAKKFSLDEKQKWLDRKAERRGEEAKSKDFAMARDESEVGPDAPGAEWATKNPNDHFTNDPVHTYIDLGAAGAFLTRTPPTFSPNKDLPIGQFTVREGYIPADKTRGLPAFKNSLICSLMGQAYVTDAQAIVRLGVMAHEAMARGWKGINLDPMPEQFREEAYLACRRAGFRHDQIKVGGKPFTSPDLIEKGDTQRDRIEKQFKKEVPIEEVKKLALDIQNPDVGLTPQQFFGLPLQRQQELFTHGATTSEQRAAIVADTAFNIAANVPDAAHNLAALLNHMVTPQDGIANTRSLSDQEKADFILALHTKNPERAVTAFATLPTEAQKAVFKLLPMTHNPKTPIALAAGIMMNIPVLGDRSALFKELGTIDAKVRLLEQNSLSTSVLHDLVYGMHNLDDSKALVSELVKKDTPESREALSRLLVEVSKRYLGKCNRDHAGGLAPLGNAEPSVLLKWIQEKASGTQRDKILDAFINNAELRTVERNLVLSDVKRTEPVNPTILERFGKQLKVKDIVNAMKPENVLCLIQSDAGFAGTQAAISAWCENAEVSRANQTAIEILWENAHLAGLAHPATIPQSVRDFISAGNNIDNFTALCVGLLSNLRSEYQQSVILGGPIGGAAPPLPPLNLLTAHKLLNALPDTAVDLIVQKIGRNPGNPDQASDVLFGLDPKRIAAALLRANDPNRAKRIIALILNGVEQPVHHAKAFEVIKALGVEEFGKATAKNVAELVAAGTFTPNGLFELRQVLITLVKDKDIKLFAELMESISMKIPDPANFDFPYLNQDVEKMLPYVNHPRFINSLLTVRFNPVAANLNPVARDPQEMANVINAIKDVKDIATGAIKIKADVVQAKALKAVDPNQDMVFLHLNENTQHVVFHVLSVANQQKVLTQIATSIVGVGATAHADRLIGCLSDPRLSKEARATLWNQIPDGSKQEVLEHFTRPSAAFFMTVLETAVDKKAVVAKILDGGLNTADPLDIICLKKLAQACAVSKDLTVEDFKSLFKDKLGEIFSNDATDENGITELRVFMLEQLVQKGRGAEARTLFNSLDAGAQKDAVKARMEDFAQGKFNENAFRAAVGSDPKPEAQVRPGVPGPSAGA